MTPALRDKAAALRFVNRVRKWNGAPPIEKLPSGERRDPCSCPVAQGIWFHLSAKEVCVGNQSTDIRIAGVLKTYKNPQCVTNFLVRFDAGCYEYEELYA